MKLVNPSAQFIEQEDSIIGAFKNVELAGRIAYKSEDKITEDSWLKFAKMLMDKKHYSPFEFGTIYLTLDVNSPLEDQEYVSKKNMHTFYKKNPYSKIVTKASNYHTTYYITTNLRVIIENDRWDDLKYQTERTEHTPRICVKIVTSRDISHEFVRHRAFSWLQESSRYCNYSSSKFDNNVTFVIPAWMTNILKEGMYSESIPDKIDITDPIVQTFLNSLLDDESYYFDLLNYGWKPQQARQVLPNALKTELMMCGYPKDWDNFFKLRLAPNAHPSAQQCAELITQAINYGN